MCYVIVTSRTLLWTLLTIATTLAMLAAVVTPSWLIGTPRRPGFRSKYAVKGDLMERELYSPTLGIYNRCVKIHKINQIYSDNCAPFVTSFGMPSEQFPNFWKAALVFFACGLALMVFTVITSLLGCCVRSIVRKSIFTVSGTIQAIAGLAFYLAIGSTLVTFICSVLSVQAEISTSTDKVQDEILEGKTLICLM